MTVQGYCICRQIPCAGLDCGVYLPGRAPRKPLPPKTAAEHAETRAKAWATRRTKASQVTGDLNPATTGISATSAEMNQA